MDEKRWNIRKKDGTVYGPAGTETIKQWIAENRIFPEDHVSPENTEDWKEIREIGEFSSSFFQEKTIFSLPEAQQRTLTTQVVSDARKILKKNFFPIVGVSVLYFGIFMLVGLANHGDKGFNAASTLISLLIGGPLTAGWYGYCLGKIRNQETRVKTLFSGFKVFGPALGAYLFTYLLVFLGFIGLIVPGLILSAAFSLTLFFVIDKNIGPWESMKASFDLTKGYRWRVFSVYSLCLLINVLGLLCLIVGVFVTVPISTLALAVLYERLKTGNIHDFQKKTAGKEILLALVVPILFLAILGGMFFLARNRARPSANRAMCMSNLKQTGLALHMYSQDYNGQFPVTLKALYVNKIYLSDPKIFHCPADKDPVPTGITNNEIDAVNSARISYQYSPGHQETENADLPIVWDNGCSGNQRDNHGNAGGDVLHLDGHVSWLPAAKWQNTAHGEASYPGNSGQSSSRD